MPKNTSAVTGVSWSLLTEVEVASDMKLTPSRETGLQIARTRRSSGMARAAAAGLRLAGGRSGR